MRTHIYKPPVVLGVLANRYVNWHQCIFHQCIGTQHTCARHWPHILLVARTTGPVAFYRLDEEGKGREIKHAYVFCPSIIQSPVHAAWTACQVARLEILVWQLPSSFQCKLSFSADNSLLDRISTQQSWWDQTNLNVFMISDRPTMELLRTRAFASNHNSLNSWIILKDDFSSIRVERPTLYFSYKMIKLHCVLMCSSFSVRIRRRRGKGHRVSRWRVFWGREDRWVRIWDRFPKSIMKQSLSLEPYRGSKDELSLAMRLFNTPSWTPLTSCALK